MEIKEGMFAEVIHMGDKTTVFIFDVMYFEGKIYYATVESLNKLPYWQKAYWPNEYIRTWHDTEHEHYKKWKRNGR